MVGGRDLVHPDPYVREMTLAYVKDTIKFASQVGAGIALATPAVGKLAPVAGLAQERRWMVEAMREAQDLAGELGIRLGIECINRFESYLCNTSEAGVELANEVGDGFGVILDIFHMNIEEADIREALRTAGPLLLEFHVADSNRRPPGQGHIDWSEVFDGLDEIGFDGNLTVEFFYTHDLSPDQFEEDVRASIGFLRSRLDEATPVPSL